MKRKSCVSIWLSASVLLLTACGGGGGNGGGGGDAGGNDVETPTTFTVSTNAGLGGSISPATVEVNEGETATFTISTTDGYTIDEVTGCGGTLVGNTFTTGPVTSDCTVTASFASIGLPKLSITDASVTEGDNGTTTLSFTVTLSALANGDVDVNYSTGDGSAMAGSDYIAATNGTLVIPAGSTSAAIAVSILGDTIDEIDESFIITLNSSSANVTLDSATAIGTIIDDDTPYIPLNDTGITTCADDANNGLACPQVEYPGQDAEHGRDAQALAGSLSKIGDGRAGFDFTKLDANGNPLADQSVAYTTTPWHCVKDNVTGLIWEVKTTDGGVRDAGHTYTWYNSTGINDGGDPGVANGGTCVDGSNCDTEKYVAAVNAIGLCGRTDWRLPKVEELLSLLDYSVAYPFIAIDTAYFPNTMSIYWSASPYADSVSRAWSVGFDSRTDMINQKIVGHNVRLVSDGR